MIENIKKIKNNKKMIKKTHQNVKRIVFQSANQNLFAVSL